MGGCFTKIPSDVVYATLANTTEETLQVPSQENLSSQNTPNTTHNQTIITLQPVRAEDDEEDDATQSTFQNTPNTTHTQTTITLQLIMPEDDEEDDEEFLKNLLFQNIPNSTDHNQTPITVQPVMAENDEEFLENLLLQNTPNSTHTQSPISAQPFDGIKRCILLYPSPMDPDSSNISFTDKSRKPSTKRRKPSKRQGDYKPQLPNIPEEPEENEEYWV